MTVHERVLPRALRRGHADQRGMESLQAVMLLAIAGLGMMLVDHFVRRANLGGDAGIHGAVDHRLHDLYGLDYTSRGSDLIGGGGPALPAGSPAGPPSGSDAMAAPGPPPAAAPPPGSTSAGPSTDTGAPSESGQVLSPRTPDDSNDSSGGPGGGSASSPDLAPEELAELQEQADSMVLSEADREQAFDRLLELLEEFVDASPEEQEALQDTILDYLVASGLHPDEPVPLVRDELPVDRPTESRAERDYNVRLQMVVATLPGYALTGGRMYVVDPDTGTVHKYRIFGHGPAWGIGGRVSSQLGFLTTSSDPASLGGPASFSVSGPSVVTPIPGVSIDYALEFGRDSIAFTGGLSAGLSGALFELQEITLTYLGAFPDLRSAGYRSPMVGGATGGSPTGSLTPAMDPSVIPPSLIDSPYAPPRNPGDVTFDPNTGRPIHH